MSGATLLISLGTSPAIVPEAFLLPEIDFEAVHVLTTDSTDVSFVEEWFAGNAPGVILTITRVAGFKDFKSEEDHFRFDEVLYRWMLAKRGSEPAFVCLSGGFKTMSAAVQKAAAVLGAAEVFHVLCDLPLPRQPKTADQIRAACSEGHLHWIKLGAEGGWPQFRKDSAAEFPLPIEKNEGWVTWAAAPDQGFRDRLAEIVDRSHRIAENWNSLASLPFQILATWPAADLEWLAQPVDPELDRDWIAGLPKVELHCHLGGFATDGELLRSVRSAAHSPGSLMERKVPAPPPGWPLDSESVSLEEYTHFGDANGSALLVDPGCLRRHCELLYEHLLEQNLLYAEIRCSPANYADEKAGRSPWRVLDDIIQTFNTRMKAARETGGAFCHINLIVIATRKGSGDFRAGISRHLALAVTAAEHWRDSFEGCRVVGVDLAGYENVATRAHYFREEFSAVHRCGLALTVHAGENDDAEGIWRAVFDLNARRLGHALHLAESPDLLRSVADRGIGVEMCPYANYQIRPGRADEPGGIHHARCGKYPLREFLDKGVPVTVNTDNIGISAGSLTDNLVCAARLCPGLTRMDLLRLQANALAIAFVPPEQRERLRANYQSRLILP